MNRFHRIFFTLVLIASCVVAAGDPPPDNSKNAAALNGSFALKNAPKFESSAEQREVIDRVISEMKGGYGGTLVTAKGPDHAMDTPAFLSAYLREFSALPEKRPMHSYDYRFERILSRASQYPVMLDDKRLDWDIWRAFLIYESFTDGKNSYLGGTSSDGSPMMNSLDSAKDLAWMYLSHHGDALVKDKARMKWWIEQIADGIQDAAARPLRRWFLLHLCAMTDVQPPPPPPEKPQTLEELLAVGTRGSRRAPSAYDPFIIVKHDAKLPPFAEALDAITRPVGLKFEVWGADPAKMPATKAMQGMLSQGTSVNLSYTIGQESWSDLKADPFEWNVGYFRTWGQRARYSNALLPSKDRKDGVFFFVFKKRLHVWPKADMDSAVLQMLHVAGLIDDVTWAEFQNRGFRELKKTIASQ